MVEMQSYTLPPVGTTRTTRYYCSLSRARVLHDVHVIRRSSALFSLNSRRPLSLQNPTIHHPKKHDTYLLPYQ
jgi:hypothetical protein